MHNQPHARRAGRLTLVHKKTAPTLEVRSHLEDQQQDSRASTRSDQDANQSALRFKRLAAAFAARGISLFPLYGEALYMAKPGWNRVLRNMDDAERMLRWLGGPLG